MRLLSILLIDRKEYIIKLVYIINEVEWKGVDNISGGYDKL